MNSVYCIHPNINSIDSLAEYLGLKDDSIVDSWTWETENPTYLFVSEHIYTNKHFNRKYKKYASDKKIVKIFVAGESIYPDMNLFDYALVFNRELKDDDRIHRIPPTILHRKSIFLDSNNISKEQARELLKCKNKFCCFVYSNWNAHYMRDRIFFEISKYKFVDSLGKHLNNTGIKPTNKLEKWRELSVEIKSRYKFSIAAENASYEGYVSEKIITSFQAHTIPIYWGDPNIGEEYNRNAFIDCNSYSSFDEIRRRIKEIDENDELWCDMISQPWKTKEQQENTDYEIEGYYEFIKHIFEQPLQQAYRIPYGTYPEIYRDYIYKGIDYIKLRNSLIGKLIRYINYMKK